MYHEDNYIQLSALQHYIFCPRQCGLIHVYGLWEENRFTAKGRVMHERVDSNEDETRGETHIARSLNIYSRQYGLSGRADVVEFKNSAGKAEPYPVEYKSGKPKLDSSDTVQLCAQALCLEEMLGIAIPEAAMYYGKTRRRMKVDLTEELRKKTTDVIEAVHRMVSKRDIPAAWHSKKCKFCSLNDMCMPKTGGKKINEYIKRMYECHEETS